MLNDNIETKAVSAGVSAGVSVPVEIRFFLLKPKDIFATRAEGESRICSIF